MGFIVVVDNAERERRDCKYTNTYIHTYIQICTLQLVSVCNTSATTKQKKNKSL